jgi:Fic family protein
LRAADFTEKAPGQLVRAWGPTGKCWAYVPDPLPPRLDLAPELLDQLSEADQALAELKGISPKLPTTHWLTRLFSRHEAIASCRMAGVVTNLEQLLLFEADRSEGESAAHPRQVWNYVRALEYGLDQLKTAAVSLRLLREVHARLLAGSSEGPGPPSEFRDRQIVIGPSGHPRIEPRFVPPPVPEMLLALDAFDRFLARPTGQRVPIDIALIHYQFETIHPFLEGNGRLGRLLIALLLGKRGGLPEPILDLSAYLEANKAAYADHLLDVSRSGNWTAWIEFFLTGIAVQARSVLKRYQDLLELRKTYRREIQETTKSSSILKLVDRVFDRPVITVDQAAEELDVTPATAQRHIEQLEQAGILAEAAGPAGHRVLIAPRIIQGVEGHDNEQSN